MVLPAAIIVFTILVAIPLSAYMARIMNGAYRPPRLLRWLEQKLDTGLQIRSGIRRRFARGSNRYCRRMPGRRSADSRGKS